MSLGFLETCDIASFGSIKKVYQCGFRMYGSFFTCYCLVRIFRGLEDAFVGVGSIHAVFSAGDNDMLAIILFN